MSPSGLAKTPNEWSREAPQKSIRPAEGDKWERMLWCYRYLSLFVKSLILQLTTYLLWCSGGICVNQLLSSVNLLYCCLYGQVSLSCPGWIIVIRADLCHKFFPSLFFLMRTRLFHFCFTPCVSTHLRELSQGHMMCCTNGCWLQPGSKPHCCHSSMSRISASCLLCPPGMFPVAVV